MDAYTSMNLRKMLRALIVAAFASALVYAVMIFLGDGPRVFAALRRFPLGTFLLMLLLGVGCYVIRALRWCALMRVVNHPMRIADGLYVQFAGQTMSVSPGRLGEVLKPWLSREIAGLPMGRGIALMFAERVADLIAVCLLSLGGLAALGGGSLWLMIGLGAIVAGTLVASSGWFHRLALGVIARKDRVRRHHASAKAISETIRAALDWRVLLWSVSASVVAWGLEGVGFAMCLRALGYFGLDAPSSISVYAVSTIVGAFTFLPGGIGLTEASMAGILVATGMGASGASAATLLTRVTTLWWGVVIGWSAIASRPGLLRQLLAMQDGTDESPAEESA